MFARFEKSLVGLSYAEIQKVVYAVINRTYDPNGIIKLSEKDKNDIVWEIIGHIFEQSEKFDPAMGKAVSWIWPVASNKFNDILDAKRDNILRHKSIDIPRSPLADSI